MLSVKKGHSLVESCETIVDILKLWAQVMPANKAFSFLANGESIQNEINWSSLDAQARSVAGYFVEHKLKGERAILLMPPSQDFITAFMGCLYAGVIAVPAYPPRNARNKPRIEAIMKNASVRIAFTTRSILEKYHHVFEQSESLVKVEWLVLEDLLESEIQSDLQGVVSKESIAFLQYTSGSTGDPKGVMITHDNLINNAKMTAHAMGLGIQSVGVFWLPPYHDMGLIGGILQSIYGGYPSYLMSPSAFLQRPFRWLHAITTFGGTLSGGPNFAYDVCVNKITDEECESINLDTWAVAFNGAEPIEHKTIERFIRKFGKYGLHKSAMYPCYGLAESTLMVSGAELGVGYKSLSIDAKKLEEGRVSLVDEVSSNARVVVSSGKMLDQVEVLIAGPQNGTTLCDNMIGEICVAGPSVAKGYWKQKIASTKTFTTNWIKDSGNQHYLRTGDLGFLHENEIYVTGRIKDVIVVRGRNIYPQDIESVALTVDMCLRPGAGAAFPIEVDGAEHVCLVCELEYRKTTDTQVLASKIREIVLNQLDVLVQKIVFIRAGTLPKTSSGKVQRRECKKRLQQGALLVRGIEELDNTVLVSSDENQISLNTLQHLPLSECTAALTKYLSSKLTLSEYMGSDVTVEQASLSELGLDSLTIVDLQVIIEKDIKIHLPTSIFYEVTSLADLAHILAERILKVKKSESKSYDELPKIVTNSKHLSVPFELTEIQRAYLIGRDSQFDLGNIGAHGYLELDAQNIDIEKISCALNKLIQRHAMLRAVITNDGKQKILSKVPLYQIKVTDLRSLPKTDAFNKLSVIRKKRSHHVYTPSQWPLFSITASQLDNKTIRLHLSFDLLIGDAWSLMLISKELKILYENSNAFLEPLDISFRDYINAEAKLCELEMYQRSKSYWNGRIDNLYPAPDLPLVKCLSSVKTPEFIRRCGSIKKNAWVNLKIKGKKLGLTPSGLLLSVFSMLINKWSKNSQFCINLTLFNRFQLHPQVNSILGDFTSMILFEANFSKKKNFIDAAKDLQKQLWNDLDNRHYSGVKVMSEVSRRKGGIGTAAMPIVFTSMLGHERRGNYEHGFFNWIGNRVYAISQTPQVYFDHQVWEDDGDLMYSWDTIDELFPSDMMDDMFVAYEMFLLELSKDDSAWFSEEMFLLPKKQAIKRQAANDTVSEISDETLDALFLKQVNRVPGNIALISSNGKITYKELADRCIRLAVYLRRLELSSNQLVAICMEKGCEQIVSVLAINIAGAAYLPIASDLPQQRINNLLDVSGATVMLTQSWLVDKLDSLNGVTVIEVDQFSINTSPKNTVKLPSRIHHNKDLAYVIYTSGSTGKPKGVAIDHRGAVNTILAINRLWNISEEDRVLALSSLSFDLSVYDIFGILASGGTIVIPDVDGLRDPAHWSRLIDSHKITIWNSVPALMDMLTTYLESQSKSTLDSLRLVLLSGDWISLSLPAAIKNNARKAEVVSLGGATEVSIWSIYFSIKKVEANWHSIPYGKPLANQTFHVLDDNLEPCPEWVQGNLYIGGIGLAKEYWKDSVRTSECFIIHSGTGERLYKTGDTGRYLGNGNIEFMGRIDNQVKIRGYRVELGEIETVMLNHPAVRNVVVVARESKSGNKQLIVYWIAEGNMNTSQNEFIQYLCDLLPSYMVPKTFILLERFPLTLNGKVDSKALPEPENYNSREISDLGIPRTYEECLLHEIWRDELKLEKIGLNENFFDLGGDSILVTSVMARVQEAGYKLNIKQFFLLPTIASIATSMVPADNNKLSSCVPGTEVRLLPIQQWFFSLDLDHSHPHNAPVLFEMPPETNIKLLQKAFNNVIAHHDAFRLIFRKDNNEWRQVYDMDQPLVSFIYRNDSYSDEIKKHMKLKEFSLEIQKSINLSVAPLVSVGYLDYGNSSDHSVLVCIHHLVIDGISWKIFLRDVLSVYMQLVNGAENHTPLSSVTTYRDFSQYLYEYANSSDIVTELDYWISKARKLAPLLSEQKHGRAATLASSNKALRRFTVAETDSLSRNEFTHSGIQLHHILLWGLVKTIALERGIEPILLVDLRSQGREIVDGSDILDVSRTIGWVNALFPVLFDIRECQSPMDELLLIKNQLEQVPNKGIGYGLLRYMRSDPVINEKLSKLPQAGICFNYLGHMDSMSSKSGQFKLKNGIELDSHGTVGYHPHLLDIKSAVYDGGLQIEIRYSENIHSSKDINHMLDIYIAVLSSVCHEASGNQLLTKVAEISHSFQSDYN